VQVETSFHSGWGASHGDDLSAGGNPHGVLTVRQGNYRPLQADTGTPGILPGVFPAAANYCRYRLNQGRR